MNVTEIIKDANLLHKVLDEMVQELDEKNMVQVVTDNPSNYAEASKKITYISNVLFF